MRSAYDLSGHYRRVKAVETQYYLLLAPRQDSGVANALALPHVKEFGYPIHKGDFLFLKHFLANTCELRYQTIVIAHSSYGVDKFFAILFKNFSCIPKR